MKDFAERVIEHDSNGLGSAETQSAATFHACEKLRPHLSNLMGATGFSALLARSLALAAAEIPWLHSLHVSTEGSLEGPNEQLTKVIPAEVMNGRVVVLAQLLGLLVAFIGEDLTRVLVLQVWPGLAPHELDAGNRRGT